MFVCIDHTEHVRSRRLVAHFALVISHFSCILYFLYFHYFLIRTFHVSVFCVWKRVSYSSSFIRNIRKWNTRDAHVRWRRLRVKNWNWNSKRETNSSNGNDGSSSAADADEDSECCLPVSLCTHMHAHQYTHTVRQSGSHVWTCSLATFDALLLLRSFRNVEMNAAYALRSLAVRLSPALSLTLSLSCLFCFTLLRSLALAVLSRTVPIERWWQRVCCCRCLCRCRCCCWHRRNILNVIFLLDFIFYHVCFDLLFFSCYDCERDRITPAQAEFTRKSCFPKLTSC